VLHLCGHTPGAAEELKAAYAKAEIPARVETFCNEMGLAWSAATIAISRSGAGSVAEAWANATPTIFLPYPYHKDQHQRLNALPLSEAGAALLMSDQIDPRVNAKQITGPLLALMTNAQRRIHMAELMRQKMPPDGADVVAQWLMRAVG
jgi:UDP-N-acetylglucosamine--N-acetylmuramyl-(pentapeptide) pyrophosphoryl-undecaprenol N-acetylglucosamine transferase